MDSRATRNTPTAVPGTRHGKERASPRQSMSWCSRTNVTRGISSASQSRSSGISCGATKVTTGRGDEPEAEPDEPLNTRGNDKGGGQDGHHPCAHSENRQPLNRLRRTYCMIPPLR